MLLLAAPFIALTQITVYAGAIMVLFLFVIMLLGAERLRTGTILPWQRPAAFALGVILVVEAIYVIIFRTGPAYRSRGCLGRLWHAGGHRRIALQHYLLPFEVISILLLAAMVGAIVLTKKRKQMARPGSLRCALLQIRKTGQRRFSEK